MVGLAYSPVNYYTLGAVYPRERLRQPYPARVRTKLVPSNGRRPPAVNICLVAEISPALELVAELSSGLAFNAEVSGGLDLSAELSANVEFSAEISTAISFEFRVGGLC